MHFEHRYDRNMSAFSPEEVAKIHNAKVCVVGCGSIGGYAIEMLARLGVGTLVVIDGDVFEETNLNRMILCDEGNMGVSKAQAAKERVAKINSEVEVITHEIYITDENALELIEGCDLVLEALDSLKVRRILARACSWNGVPMIHGAMLGWYCQVSTIIPGDTALDRIYPSGADHGSEKELGKPAFTPALTASIEVAEAMKVLLNKGVPLRNKMLSVDLLLQEYEVFDL